MLCINIFRDGKEIAVAYYRAGYTPEDYYSKKVYDEIFELWP